MAEFPNLRLLESPEGSKASAVNLALSAHASPAAQWLVRCDVHPTYPQNFILHVTEALNRTGAAGVMIAQDAVAETCFQKAVAWVSGTLLGSAETAHPGGRKSRYVGHGSPVGFDAAWFTKVGGYDGALRQNGDTDYVERIRQAGGKLWLEADLRLEYMPPASVRALAGEYFNHGKDRAQILHRHGQRLKLQQLAPILLLALCMTGLIAGFFQWQAFMLPAAYISLLAGASAAITLKHKSACGLFAGVAAGVIHLAWTAGFVWQSVAGKR